MRTPTRRAGEPGWQISQNARAVTAGGVRPLVSMCAIENILPPAQEIDFCLISVREFAPLCESTGRLRRCD